MKWQTIYNISDRALGKLLLFLQSLCTIIARLYNIPKLAHIAGFVPSSLHRMKGLIGLNTDHFEKFVVCPKCDNIYKLNQCYETTSTGKKKSARCRHVNFPNHPQKQQRRPCNTLLMKSVRSNNGQDVLVPKKLYCYNSIKSALETMIQRKGFMQACRSWKHRDTIAGVKFDHFDGNIWRELQKQDGLAFMEDDYMLGLILNVDWFQPFKHSQHSVGVMYVVVQNLPRDIRYKEHNVIILGVIPGPKEPKETINTFLKPFIDELMDMFQGVQLKDHSACGSSLYRAALLCVACDIPASRKTAGFPGHGALFGMLNDTSQVASK